MNEHQDVRNNESQRSDFQILRAPVWNAATPRSMSIRLIDLRFHTFERLVPLSRSVYWVSVTTKG
jgi:hypothetical protein